MKSYERRTKVARALQREIANFIQTGGVKDDRLGQFVSIVDVDLNVSLSSAKVHFSILSNSDDPDDDVALYTGTQAALNEYAGQIRGLAARKLNLKYAPKLIFIPCEQSLSQSVDLVSLIDKTVEHDDEVRGLSND